MKKTFSLLCFFLSLIFSDSNGQSQNQTLPFYHWSNTYIHALQDRGYLSGLNRLNEPYRRGEIAKSLLNCLEQVNRDKDQGLPLPIWTLDMIKVLVQEFKDEIQWLRAEKNENNDKQDIEFFTYLTPVLDKSETQKFEYRGRYRIGAEVNLDSHLYAYTGGYFNQYDYLDPDYAGYKWRGVAAYTEQAYIQGSWGKFKVKLGRDFLKWGTGRSGTLTLSNQYRPLDQIYASTKVGPFQFSFLASRLNPFKTSLDTIMTIFYNRYLSGHRLDLFLWNGRFQAGISELIIYGGAYEPMNLTYLNPFIFYHGEKKNRAGDNNVLPTIDVSIYPMRNVHCYGSVLIDDIQVEKTEPGDLEPNEIGWLIGASWSEFFKIAGSSFYGEFVRVPNRTYKTPHFWEQFTNQNQALGHPLDSDFDYWEMGLEQWVGTSLRFDLKYSRFRKGVGSLFKTWDEPWYDSTLEEGYSEPYLSGIVEKTQTIGINLQYFHRGNFGFDISYQHINTINTHHLASQENSYDFYKIGLWVSGQYKITF